MKRVRRLPQAHNKKETMSRQKPDPNYTPSEQDFEVEDVSTQHAGETLASDEPKLVDNRKPFELWFEENKGLVILGAILATLAVSAFLLFRQAEEDKYYKLSHQYSSSTEHEDYDKLISESPGTIQAGNSLLNKSKLFLEYAENDKAYEVVEKFVNEYTDHPLHAQGYISLGSMKERDGNVDEALELYETVITEYPEHFMAPYALMRKGDIIVGKGEYEDARVIYEEIPLNYPGLAKGMDSQLNERLRLCALLAKEKIDAKKSGDVSTETTSATAETENIDKVEATEIVSGEVEVKEGAENLLEKVTEKVQETADTVKEAVVE